MNILLIEEDPHFRKTLARALIEKCQVSVIESESGVKALEILKGGKVFDLIISDFDSKNGSTENMLKYLSSVGANTRFILCSAQVPKPTRQIAGYDISGSVVKPNVLDGIIALIEKFRPLAHSFDSTSLHAFFEVNLDTITKTSPICCPYYIRLSENKFVKIMQTGDPFTDEDLKRFKTAKQVDSLFIRTEDCALLVSALAKSSVNLLDFKESLNTPEGIQRLAEFVTDPVIREDLSNIAMMLKVSALTPGPVKQSVEPLFFLHNEINNRVRKLGFNDEVVTLVTASVNLALSVIAASDPLREAIKKFLFQPEDYFASHSVYLAQISCAIASLMGWGSPSTRHKLATASFVHDLALDNQRLVILHSNCDQKVKEIALTEKEQEIILDHPTRVMSLLKQSDNILAHNIADIVTQHHERPDGSGYPNNLKGNKISPLATIFIVSHDLVDYMLSSISKDVAISDFLRENEETYQHGGFKKVFSVLQKSCL